MKLKKKGFFNQLSALGIGVATLIVVLVIAFLIGAQAKTNMGTDGPCDSSSFYYNGSVCCNSTISCNAPNNTLGFSDAWNATNDTINAVATIPDRKSTRL